METRTEGKTLLEESPVESHQSNGGAERGVQEIEGQIRAIFISLQDRLERKLDARERIVAFIPEYAAYLVNRLQRGRDGKVPYERLKGKCPTVMGIEFGEKVLWKKKKGDRRKELLRERWEYGIFLGVRVRSNECMIGTPDGIEFARSIHRLNKETQRWGRDNTNWIKCAPWHHYVNDPQADGEVPEGVSVGEQETGIGPEGPKYVDVREKVPRDFRITQEDVRKYGQTRGCHGCNSLFMKRGIQQHSDQCRNRYRGNLKDSARVRNHEIRLREFEERQKQAARDRPPGTGEARSPGETDTFQTGGYGNANAHVPDQGHADATGGLETGTRGPEPEFQMPEDSGNSNSSRGPDDT